MNRIQSHATEILGSVVSTTGSATAIAAWQAQLAWGITVGAGLIAIISGLFTIYSILRKSPPAQPGAR